MSLAVFPTLIGLGWNVKHGKLWKTRSQEAISGKSARISDWVFPRHQWELSFEFLGQGTISGQVYSDLANLMGFFDLRQGMFDSWLYQDAEFNSVTDQSLGAGDGTTTVFQLLATTSAGFIEPVLAPNVVTAVKINGVTQAANTYSVNAGTGQITFTSAPGNGLPVTWTGTYYWLCQFAEDHMDFEKFMQGFWQAKSVKFLSLKSA